MSNPTLPDPFQLTLGGGMHSAIRTFGDEAHAPVLCIHGSIEDGRIFYSRSGKGFAPWLAAQGYHVYVPDMAGKGQSVPGIMRGFAHSQEDFIDRDMDAYVRYIRHQHGDAPIRLVAHSWGGVLLLAWMARYADVSGLGPAVFFASKRRIAVQSPRRWFMVDLMWTLVGELGTSLFGYLPAKKLGMGSENEPAAFYREVNRWVYSNHWIGNDQFDYREALSAKKLPPILYFAGAHDRVLGHPKDVKRLMKETGQTNAGFQLLGKANGHRKDYGHINLLTDAGCPTDHFPMALQWLNRGNTTW